MARTPAKKNSATRTSETFTADERAAMRERVKELASGGGKDADRRAVLDRIAALPQPERALAERIHAIVTAAAPELAPKTWYGMPAYAKDGQIVCFFQSATKFKTRYATLGFSDKARLDDGRMWATSYALTTLTAAEEARIAALVKQAVG